MSELQFDNVGGITIVVQDEDERTLGWVKREGRFWRATTVAGRDKGLWNSPQVAILNVAGNRLKTGTR